MSVSPGGTLIDSSVRWSSTHPQKQNSKKNNISQQKTKQSGEKICVKFGFKHLEEKNVSKSETTCTSVKKS